MTDVRVTATARHELARLPDATQTSILDALTKLAFDPATAGKRLRGRLAGVWSLRVDDFRVLYTIETDAVIVRSIRHREAAYERGV